MDAIIILKGEIRGKSEAASALASPRMLALLDPSGQLEEALLPPAQQLVDGKLTGATGGATYPILDPATGQEIGVAPDSTAADVDADLDIGSASAKDRWG